MSDEMFMYANIAIYALGMISLAYSRSIRSNVSEEESDEENDTLKEETVKEESDVELEIAKYKDFQSRIDKHKQNIEKENAEMDHLVFLSSIALASIAGGITMGNLSAKESNKARRDMDEFIKVQKDREFYQSMVDVMELSKKQQDELQKKEQSEKKEYDTDTYSYERPRARVKNNPITNVLVYNLIQEFRQYPLTAVERSLYAAEVDNIKEGSRTIDQSIIIDNIRKKYSTEREDDRSNEDMAMMNDNSPGKRPIPTRPSGNKALDNLLAEFNEYPLNDVEKSLCVAEFNKILGGSGSIEDSSIINHLKVKYATKKKEEPAMSLYPLPKTEELTLKEKLKQHDTYNGYYPNIKKVDLTQPIKFKKISLVINRYLTIPISEVAKDCLIGGDQYYLECLLAVYRMEKDNKYKIPSYINVKNLRFFYEESRILCVDEDDLDTRVVKVKVQGSTISLPSSSTRRDIIESISLLYPYVDLRKAYYDSDAHLYDFDSKNLILKSKKKLSDDELNKALLQEEFSTTFKHIYGDVIEVVSESVQVVSSSKFADNIKADIIDASSFFPDEHEYPLRFPGSKEKEKEVVAREWFLGIEETEAELKARYKKQENSIAGWDDF